MSTSADRGRWQDNQHIREARLLLDQALPHDRKISRRRISAAANEVWAQFGRGRRRQITAELRNYGFYGNTNWKVFLNFALTVLPGTVNLPRSARLSSRGEGIDTPTWVLAQTREFILNTFHGRGIGQPPGRRQLLDSLVPFWQGLRREERMSLTAALRDEGYKDGSLVENIVAYASAMLATSALEGPGISISGNNGNQTVLNAKIRINRSRNHHPRGQKMPAGGNRSSTRSPRTQTARTGDGRLAPSSKYCGAPTELARTYTFCDAVEKTREEWGCIHRSCEGHSDPMLVQYALTEFSRRG